jgi:hypothetical protein
MMPRIAKRPKVYMGIDPGKSGGIALLFGREVIAIRMPDTPADVLEWIRGYSSDCIACMEQVGGYAGEGQPGSAMFNFGRGYGNLEMALLACEVSFELVSPRRWQKAMGISPRGKTETRTAWKNRIKETVQRLFPSEKVTLATADALLIALYRKRKCEGTL